MVPKPYVRFLIKDVYTQERVVLYWFYIEMDFWKSLTLILGIKLGVEGKTTFRYKCDFLFFTHFSNGRIILIKCSLIEFYYCKQYIFYDCVGFYLSRIVIICLQEITHLGEGLKMDEDRKKLICGK